MQLRPRCLSGQRGQREDATGWFRDVQGRTLCAWPVFGLGRERLLNFLRSAEAKNESVDDRDGRCDKHRSSNGAVIQRAGPVTQPAVAATEDWRVDHLRATLFLLAEPENRDLFRTVTGQDPERVVQDARVQHFEESGLLDGQQLWLTIRRTPGRLDLIVAGIPEERLEIAPEGLRLFGRLRDERDRITQVVERLPQLQTKRFAFGATLLVPVESYADGLRTLLRKMATSFPLDESCHDFLFQINRPRDHRFQTEGLRINRLTQWMVSSFTIGALVIGAPAHLQPPIREQLASRLQLDINTDASREAALTVPLVELISVLTDFAVEITEQGDRP